MSFPIVQLGELCEMDRHGLGPNDRAAAELPFVGVENVESQIGIINFGNGSRVGSQKSTTFRFDERHILYAKLRPYLNKVAIPDFPGRCSTELVPLRPREGVDREFVAHLLRRNQTVEYVMMSVTGSRMPRTNMKALMSLPVPFPPLSEQRRIVGILNRAARTKRLRKQAQELMQEFMPALFVKMFGDPATNPMGWPVCALREICVADRQGMDSDNPAASLLPFVGVENIESRTGTINLNNDSRTGSQKSTTFPFDKRHVLYAKLRPYLNKVATPNFAGRCSTELIPFIPRDGVVRDFVAQLLRRKETVDYAMASATGSRMPRTDMNALLSLPVPCPPPDEQARFATLAKAAQATVRRMEIAGQIAVTLNASIMSRLLGQTG